MKKRKVEHFGHCSWANQDGLMHEDLLELAEDEISTHRVELAELRAENAKLRAALEEVAHGCLTEWGQVDVDKIDRVARAALRGEPK